MPVTKVRTKWSSGNLLFLDASGDTIITLDSTGKLIVAAGAQIERAGAKSQTKSADYTMAEGDSGQITYVDTDAKTITLPATVVGYTFTLVNSGADGAVALTISPNANDKIMGAGLTSADNKDIVNTKATAKTGDRVTLVGDGVNGWFVTEMVGTWAREG
jgi:hypothetical protein